MNWTDELKTAREAALEGGSKIMEIYEARSTQVEHKEDGSPVTQADLAANAAIVERLRRDFPGDAILTEEERDNLDRLKAKRLWIVDPLDGTKEFISRNGEFTVNVALAVEGEPVLGAVFIPAKNELFYAARGEGAFLEKDGGAPEALRVSDRARAREMTMAKSRSHASPKLAALIEKYGFSRTLSLGSSLKGCRIATQEADVYFRLGPTNEWDICAMHAVLAEAGGVLTDLEGAPMRYNQAKTLNSGFVASNGRIHDDLLAMAREIAS